MAHRLDSETDNEKSTKPHASSRKYQLNRRTLMKVGLVGSTAVLTGSAANVVAGDNESDSFVYWTDFSEVTL